MLKRYTVVLSDGRNLTVTPTLLDKVAFEVYLRANPRLGGIADNAFRLQGFTCWSAAKREHGLDITFDQFLEGKDPSQPHAIDIELQHDTIEAEEVEGLGELIPSTHTVG